MTDPIRILHVLGRTDIGGAESLVMSIYRNIDREKIQFDFAIHTDDRCDFDDEIESLGGRIYHLPRYKVYNHLRYINAWKNLFKNNNFHAVHGHMNSTASIYLNIAKKRGISTISHIHNVNGEDGLKSLIKNISKRNISKVADYKFACSQEAGRRMYGSNSNDFKIINNGVEVDKFLFNKYVRNEKRIELGIKNNEILIGHVGNYRPVKNHRFLVEIFNNIFNEDENYKLALVGSGVEEKVRDYIDDKAKNNVLFLGSRSDVNELLQAFDIFILPSNYEGLGLVLIEAQAAGLQCYVSNKVPQDAKITNNIKYIPIDSKNSVKIWSEEILNNSIIKRNNMINEIKTSGYDIACVAKKLERFYLNVG
ncbi:MAG: glycosyltransferase family 1 protein [Anaerococcus sp.]|uniref:glycosyltransferase family 1 protein n=1 Tax=Anaerococcus sp. TaxID=1872515 RepID=UPI0028FEF9E0|nr:glycosyltransferase family 1 protein [Anaerococcus sp.]MDU2354184.1 glycosyltransferase family 1 protein [Anaerococcus sp.]